MLDRAVTASQIVVQRLWWLSHMHLTARISLDLECH